MYLTEVKVSKPHVIICIYVLFGPVIFLKLYQSQSKQATVTVKSSHIITYTEILYLYIS